MSRGAQVGLVVLAAVVVVLVFVLVRPGDEATVAPATTEATTEATSEATPEPAPEEKKDAEEKPTGEVSGNTIDVVGGEPKGGVSEIEVKSGDQVLIEVTSDEPEEVHVHGYDLSEEVGPDQPAEFDFAADLEGVYEIELENSATPIAELRVTP